MLSLTERIYAEVRQIELLLDQLMQHSDIVRWNYSAIKVSGMSDYKWTELSEEGKKLQCQATAAYRRFLSFVRCLRSDLSAADGRALEAAAQKVLSIIEQTNYLHTLDKEAHFLAAASLIDKQRRLLSTVYKITDACSIVIPDPALLTKDVHPEEWKLKEIDNFKIVLLSPVKLQQAANARLLPWLELDSRQDQMIAACMEITKGNPRSHVVLATNDPVLQIKAAAANLPCITAPLIEPAATEKLADSPAPMPASPAGPLPETPPITPPAAKTRTSTKPEAARNRPPAKQTAAANSKPPANRPSSTRPIVIPIAIRPEMLNPIGLQPPLSPNNAVIATPKVSSVKLDFMKPATKGPANVKNNKPGPRKPNR